MDDRRSVGLLNRCDYRSRKPAPNKTSRESGAKKIGKPLSSSSPSSTSSSPPPPFLALNALIRKFFLSLFLSFFLSFCPNKPVLAAVLELMRIQRYACSDGSFVANAGEVCECPGKQSGCLRCSAPLHLANLLDTAAGRVMVIQINGYGHAHRRQTQRRALTASETNDYDDGG